MFWGRTARDGAALHLGRFEGVEADDELRTRVRRDFPPRYEIDFRMSQEGDDKSIPPQAAAE